MDAQRRESFVELKTKSLIAFIFGTAGLGDTGSRTKAAGRRAYRDWCRTLSLKSIDSDSRDKLRDEGNNIVISGLYELYGSANQEQFDARHLRLRDQLIRHYETYSLNLTHGQAQKWINMTAKYMVILEDEKAEDAADFLHVPLDNLVLQAAERDFDADLEHVRWSKMNSDDYQHYQLELRRRIMALPDQHSPIEWEFGAWLQA